MLVKDWMSSNVITVKVGDTVRDVVKIFMQHNPSLIPVVSNGKAVGLVTLRDLQRLGDTESSWLDVRQIPAEVWERKVETIMSRSVVAVPPDYTVEETSELLLDRRIPGCPVLDHDGRVVGIITKKDLLRAFKESSTLTGLGVLFGILVQDREGCVNDVLRVLRRYDARLFAIMSSYANVPKGTKRLYIRCFSIDRAKMDELRRELNEVARIIFIVDRKKGTREIYAE